METDLIEKVITKNISLNLNLKEPPIPFLV